MAAIVTASLALAALGVTVAVTEGSDAKEGSDVISRREPARATTAQQELLTRIRRGIVQPEIVQARLGRPPRGMQRRSWRKAGRWLYFVVKPRSGLGYTRGYWQALIIEGLLGSESARMRLPVIRGDTLTVEARDGQRRRVSSSIVFIHAGPRLTADPAELREVALEASQRVGVRIIDMRFNRPLRYVAPELVVQTDDPERFRTNVNDNVWALMGPLIEDPERGPLTEGAYVEVRDNRGRIVVASGYSIRVRHGTRSTSPA